MKPAQIILLSVAVLTGGLAFFLLMRGGTPTPQTVVTEVTKQEAKLQVLVARNTIGVGERLTPQSVQWQDWPEGAVRPEYVTSEATPDATDLLVDTVARFEFFPGEPIREAKLVRADQGYLSAVLSKGMRGVSVPVDAASSAGGFIVPNDHVDVLLTRMTAGGQTSEAVLTNVRILAIGKRLGEVGATGGETETAPEGGPQAQVFDDRTIATLELDPSQAETLMNAKSQGSLSLALRSMADFNNNNEVRTNSSQAVRLVRYGKQSSVMSASAAPPEMVQPPAIDPALPSANAPQVTSSAPVLPEIVVQ
ncbi:Flp pilus assembly protein CpaB [Devosia rhodophyticola]|uniref:Flp pilus assembly protein CpaB n=1 Tax=Devosia rhodophyticola TaxID=3026423 RepID=A0ABY7YZG0_9HYPH|nr:Flp pilus assembly protein CpaB [Devosia rhodophyticola]WDR06773.1 Flp pilus assembly protein CpaB [Devosia rhodophyticola]